jgi:hypothetical protein
MSLMSSITKSVISLLYPCCSTSSLSLVSQEGSPPDEKQHMGGAGSTSDLNVILSERRQFHVATYVKKAAII